MEAILYLFTIIIQTVHGEEDLHNDLMFTHALVDDDSSIFHLVLNIVFLTRRISWRQIVKY